MISPLLAALYGAGPAERERPHSSVAAFGSYSPVTQRRERRPTSGKGAVMARLAQTAGLTDVQSEILATVRQFVDKEVIPHAQELEHADAYPADIVAGMKEMGLFGITIPEEYGGLGESLLTYALVVEEIARGWMSVS